MSPKTTTYKESKSSRKKRSSDDTELTSPPSRKRTKRARNSTARRHSKESGSESTADARPPPDQDDTAPPSGTIKAEEPECKSPVDSRPLPEQDNTLSASPAAKEKSCCESPVNARPPSSQDKETSPCCIIMWADPPVVKRVNESCRKFRKAFNKDVKSRGFTKERALVDARCRENGLICLYFSDLQIMKALASQQSFWSDMFGQNASVIPKTYDVIVPKFPDLDFLEPESLTGLFNKILAGHSGDRFPENEPYFHSIRWSSGGRRTAKSPVLSFYDIDVARNILKDGINYQSGRSRAKKKFQCEPYEDEPVQCTACWRYGHIAFDCESPLSCFVCGRPHHSSIHGQSNTAAPSCSNCGGTHTADFDQCPSRRTAKKTCVTDRKALERSKFF
ncbi:hypothetical protein AJ79_05372 [Helicocarpus griseus UAMH5409]|uniref:CCHC-type domain-containing protein n=1 Tax=Helicocarpus griseus UAMH5409 TaxID=1447875 RepID=A0A2B7XPX6_9EURO|nr:hypothetical protein AJ79_05372 [Helicocarpus griseus UAMH5409]